MKTTLIRGMLLALLLAGFGALVTYRAEPAGADGWQECATGQFCLYDAADGAGAAWATGHTDDTQTYPAGQDDRAVSAWNNSAYWACVYEGASYGGAVQALRPGFRGNLSLASVDLTGKVSSHKTAKSKAGCWTGFERCPDGKLCLFQEPSGRGVATVSTADDAEYGTAWDNQVRSVWNRTGLHVCFYRAPDWTSTWTVDGRDYKAYVVLSGRSTTIPTPYAPTFSSHKFVAGTSGC
ncbi:peptidase inhibitor family I36 protein [Streptomyces sp. NPDC001493]